ncbi:hypothetical protein F511_24489 [Dorcoceras hygrometricum]|uniref:Uncharacterized protein n=1 Tax=Dorcoceras hygrometricum TaxID=472368 RepID=A0A2Z7C1K7_9LAMI|nr:hypothetical protein F511_24489 [Dorcoceras hygrometricum]
MLTSSLLITASSNRNADVIIPLALQLVLIVPAGPTYLSSCWFNFDVPAGLALLAIIYSCWSKFGPALVQLLQLIHLLLSAPADPVGDPDPPPGQAAEEQNLENREAINTKNKNFICIDIHRIAVETPIRSTTRSETPSSDCTRSPDEISTIGFSSKSWPETNFRRSSGGGRRRTAARKKRVGGGA